MERSEFSDSFDTMYAPHTLDHVNAVCKPALKTLPCRHLSWGCGKTGSRLKGSRSAYDEDASDFPSSSFSRSPSTS